MAFRNRPALGGQLSFITEENATVPFVVGTTFQPIFIEVFDLPDGTVVSADVKPTPVLLTGAAVEVVASIAVFDAFSVAGSLPINETSGGFELSYVTFSALRPDGSEDIVLRTGTLLPLNQSNASAPQYARLLHYGALRHETPADVPDGVAMGDFYVGVFDRLARQLQVDATVVAAIPDGRPGTLQPVGAVYRGRGAVKVSGLTFATVGGDYNATAIEFTVRVGAWSTAFVTPSLEPRAPGATNDFFEFDAARSFIREDNAGTTAVLGVTLPPIVLQLMTSTREADASNTGLVVRAVPSRGQIVGDSALVVRGVATFADLAFSGDVAPPAAVISFSVTPSEGRTLTLRSGDIKVARTVIHAKHLVWAPWSKVTATAPTRAFIAAADGIVRLPAASVRMLDSAFGVDPEAGPIPVALVSDPPGVLDAVAGNETTIRRGSATFIGAKFRPAAGVSLPRSVRVKVVDVSPGLAGARSELISADISVDYESRVASRSPAGVAGMIPSCVSATPRSPNCELFIEFDAEETTKRTALYAEDGALYATVGNPMAVVRIRLRDLTGPFTRPTSTLSAAIPPLVAHTGDDPNRETLLDTSGGANRAVLGHDGAFTFSCLRFKAAPMALVRVRFTAVDPVIGALSALSLRSGFVRIVTVPTSDFALQFAPTATTGAVHPSPPITRPLQRSSAVVGVTLPPIVVNVVDSLGVLDSGRDTIPVTVVATTPQLATSALADEGTRAVVHNGAAVFDRLRFTRSADDVRVVFRAETTVGETVVAPVVGSTISTGAFTVAWAPHPLTHVELGAAAPVVDPVSTVLSEYGREITFGNLTDVDVTTVVKFKDSAHRPITAASVARKTSIHAGALEGLTLRTYSDEFDVDGTTSTWDATCACFVVRTRPQRWRSSTATGAPAFLHHEVVAVGPAASPSLLGQRVSVGPILVTAAIASASAGCSGGTSSATAVAEFRMPLQSFDAELTAAQLSHVMAVEPSRVTIDGASATDIERQEHDTLEPWLGVKVPVTFADPRPGDQNRQPSAALAAALVDMKGDCVAPSLNLKASHYPSADQSCDPDEFATQAQAARACMVSGQTTPCACYASLLMDDAGPRCVREQRDELQQICLELAKCSDAQIIAVCDRIPPKTRNLTGLYVSTGALGVVMLFAGVYLRRKLRQRDAARRTLAAS